MKYVQWHDSKEESFFVNNNTVEAAKDHFTSKTFWYFKLF